MVNILNNGEMEMDIAKLNSKDKCVLAIKLAEKAYLYIKDNNAKNFINNAIEVSWEWIRSGKKAGEVLYNFLDDEDTGFTLFQEMEEDEHCISAWDCIIDAIAYVSRAAYEKEGEKYLPEPIELVDDNIFIHMKKSLILCNSIKCENIVNIEKMFDN